MSQVVTVFRKEWLELVGDWRSFRGAVIQGAIVVLLTGVFIPAVSKNGVFTDFSETLIFYLVFPSVIAATAAADAFAGERERRTLETLLATPLSDRAIFGGKVAAAMIFATMVAAISVVCSAVIAVRRGQIDEMANMLQICVALVGGALGSAFITSALSVTISMYVLSARSAQQMASVLSFLVVWVAVLGMRSTKAKLTVGTLLISDFVLLAVGFIALAMSMKLFTRQRFFEKR